jgi:hypothetical protein
MLTLRLHAYSDGLVVDAMQWTRASARPRDLFRLAVPELDVDRLTPLDAIVRACLEVLDRENDLGPLPWPSATPLRPRPLESRRPAG